MTRLSRALADVTRHFSLWQGLIPISQTVSRVALAAVQLPAQEAAED